MPHFPTGGVRYKKFKHISLKLVGWRKFKPDPFPTHRSDPFGPACLPTVRQDGRQADFKFFTPLLAESTLRAVWRQILLIRKFDIQTLPFLSMPFAIQEFKFTFIINYFMCPALINQFSDFISGIFKPLTKIHTPMTNSKGT